MSIIVRSLPLIGAALCALLGSSCRTISSVTVEELTPTAQESIVPADARLELVWADGRFTEGPAAAPDGTILFTDIPNNRILRYFPDRNKSYVFRENSGRANGLAVDADGMLIVCEGGGRRLVKISADNELEVLTSGYQRKKFNSPNDLAIHPAGWIYFTDPRYGAGPERDLDFEGVFLYRRGYTTIATTQVTRPNGIVVSRDGRFAYVADNKSGPDGVRQLLRFRIRKNGNLADKTVLAELAAMERGIDGMTIDTEGNLYATAGRGDTAGVYVFSPKGVLLARIPLPDVPTNCTFGGRKDPHTLYVTAMVQAPAKGQPARFGLFRIKLLTRGIPD